MVEAAEEGRRLKMSEAHNGNKLATQYLLQEETGFVALWAVGRHEARCIARFKAVPGPEDVKKVIGEYRAHIGEKDKGQGSIDQGPNQRRE